MSARALLGALVAGALTAPALAQECRVALVLALDVSSSVDAREDRLQRDGVAKALTSERVLAAILAAGPVALYAFEWSGRDAQATILPGWAMLETAEDVEAAATAIAKSHRGRDELPTALGAALGFAAVKLREGPECDRRVVDVSGDGISNEGWSPAVAYDTFPFEGITVNALIVADPGQPSREEGAELIAWFQREVLRGPGAFSIVAEGYDDYARAMEAKLLRELEAPAVSALPPEGAGPA